MALKQKDVTIALSEGNRDNGKCFRLREMPAEQAEKWAIRATIALAHSGVDIPEEMLNAGWAALAYGALQALNKVKYEDLVPLLDEMMGQIEFVGFHPDHPDRPIPRPLTSTDIEEVETRFYLRAELFALHMNFSVPAVLSNLAAGGTTTSRRMKTSRRQSRRRVTAA